MPNVLRGNDIVYTWVEELSDMPSPVELSIPSEAFEAMVAAIRRQHERALGDTTNATPMRNTTMNAETLQRALDIVAGIMRHEDGSVRLSIQPEAPPPRMAAGADGGVSFWSEQTAPLLSSGRRAGRPSRSQYPEMTDQEPEDL